MANIDLILSILSKFSRLCDDCLSIETGISPRQTVNQICRNPRNSIKIMRDKGTCPVCYKFKINNTQIVSASSSLQADNIAYLTNRTKNPSPSFVGKRNQSPASKRREKRRNSLSTVRFRDDIEHLLVNAEPQIAYSMKKDLAAMTDMAFYKHRPEVIKVEITAKEIIKGYVLVLANANDMELTIKSLRELSKNQSQVLRKAALRYGKAKDIWEHAIPVKVLVGELLKMIDSNCFKDIDRLLDLYEMAGQRPLTKEDDDSLYTMKYSMPEGWDWRAPDVDIFARYKAVNIEVE